MNPTQSISLPLLPFGEKNAVRENNPKSYADRVALFNTSLSGYDPVGDAKAFRSKSAAIHINGMKVVSGANTPINIELGNANDINLLVPFQGSVNLQVDGISHVYGHQQGAMLLPATGRRGRSTAGSSLILTLSPQRIQETVQAMLGNTLDKAVDLRLQQARVLPMQWQNLAFDATFRHLCRVIDSLCDQPEILAHLGIDEVLYRQAAFLLQPRMFAGNQEKATCRSTGHVVANRIIDISIAYIEQHLTERITLTDLEQISGASARVLQYTFQVRFGCTPMNWIKQRRMDLARTRLLAVQPGENVTQILFECGFSSASIFSREYQKAYGELPSVTLKHRRKSLRQ